MTTTSTAAPSAILSAGRLYLRKNWPYFSAGFMSLMPRETSLHTFGVSAAGHLFWSPSYIQEIQASKGDVAAAQQVGGIILHEYFHLLLRHADRAKAIAADPETWNIAADCEINNRLRAMGCALPAEAIYPETYGLKPGALAEVYYQQLAGQRQKVPAMPGAGGDKPKRGPAAGQCGSGAGGVPFEGEDAAGPGRSEADHERSRRQCAAAIRAWKSGPQAGNTPGDWSLWADQFIKPAVIPWQQKLGRAIRQTVAYRSGLGDYSYQRPSRRQGALGYGQGTPILPSQRTMVPRIAVAVDTSGSMSPEDIERAVAETMGILRAAGGQVYFCACDCSVGTLAKLQSPTQFKALLKGGGGTSFVPAFREIGKLKPAPSVVIYLTDGCGEAPDECPAGIDVVWVLIGKDRQIPGRVSGGQVTWGDMIEIDDEGPKEVETPKPKAKRAKKQKNK